MRSDDSAHESHTPSRCLISGANDIIALASRCPSPFVDREPTRTRRLGYRPIRRNPPRRPLRAAKKTESSGNVLQPTALQTPNLVSGNPHLARRRDSIRTLLPASSFHNFFQVPRPIELLISLFRSSRYYHSVLGAVARCSPKIIESQIIANIPRKNPVRDCQNIRRAADTLFRPRAIHESPATSSTDIPSCLEFNAVFHVCFHLQVPDTHDALRNATGTQESRCRSRLGLLSASAYRAFYGAIKLAIAAPGQSRSAPPTLSVARIRLGVENRRIRVTEALFCLSLPLTMRDQSRLSLIFFSRKRQSPQASISAFLVIHTNCDSPPNLHSH
uniref:Uncharacterized protein n=1 Tax=Mycena chlorophos TaxID=658473 RepID=A0ABQ0LKN6_MYCCL|nr:predicted protein [Mycena chlorophos]